MTVMLRAEGLAKTFTLHLQGGTRIPVLDGVGFDLHAGQCLALVGPSGAGKSTLMRSLYGAYRVDAGRILVRHGGALVDIARADPRLVLQVRRDGLGYVSQFLRVVPRVPALDVVAEAAALRGRSLEDARWEAAARQPGAGVHRRPSRAIAGRADGVARPTQPGRGDRHGPGRQGARRRHRRHLSRRRGAGRRGG